MKKSLLVFISLIFILAYCKKDNNNNTGPFASFPYIKSGTVWTYINSDTDPGHTGITFESSYTINSINSGGWCSVSWKLPILTQPVTWFVSNSEFSDMGSEAQNFRFPIIKSPPVLNDIYSVSFSKSITAITDTRKVTSLNASTTVPAGTFDNCVIIHETTSEDTVYYKDYWIHPQTGIVRMEGTTKEDFPVIIIQELKTKPN